MDGKGFRGAAGRVWDAVAEAMANAITDIRQKVVEEPWFGRAVTPELVKEIDQGGGVHGTTAVTPKGGAHGRTEAGGGVHGRDGPDGGGVHGAPDKGPKPDSPHTGGNWDLPATGKQRLVLESYGYDTKDFTRGEASLLIESRGYGKSWYEPPPSVAEKLAERYAWGKDYLPTEKEAAAPGQDKEQGHDRDR